MIDRPVLLKLVMLSSQFSRQLALRSQLGNLIAQNRRLYGVQHPGNHGFPGIVGLHEDVENQNEALKTKVDSTLTSNLLKSSRLEG